MAGWRHSARVVAVRLTITAEVLDKTIHNCLTNVRRICRGVMMTERAVAYYRVSSARQGASGLGLEAQRSAVEALCASRGWELIAPPFQEVESGKHADRPELLKALDRAKLTGARLVIAKLDRLSRDAHFLLTLQKSGVEFVAADMPFADKFTVGIMAMVAQKEREAISTRTREALQAAKARGTWVKANGEPYKAGKRLGNPNGAQAFKRAGKGNTAALEAVTANATARAIELVPTVERLQSAGVVSLGNIAAALNADGILTARGGRWHASSVRNLLARIDTQSGVAA